MLKRPGDRPQVFIGKESEKGASLLLMKKTGKFFFFDK
jgi:hypothetical protein